MYFKCSVTFCYLDCLEVRAATEGVVAYLSTVLGKCDLACSTFLECLGIDDSDACEISKVNLGCV